MIILLYNPDNQVTKNYMPHLWTFVLQAVSPPGHRVFLIDRNAQPHDTGGLHQICQGQGHPVGLPGCPFSAC